MSSYESDAIILRVLYRFEFSCRTPLSWLDNTLIKMLRLQSLYIPGVITVKFLVLGFRPLRVGHVHLYY